MATQGDQLRAITQDMGDHIGSPLRFHCVRNRFQGMIIPILNVEMSVVEFFVNQIDAARVQALGKNTRAVLQVELVAQTGVEIDQAQ